jgi:hypothetical protein
VSAQLSSPQIPRDRLQYVTRPRTFGVEVSYRVR